MNVLSVSNWTLTRSQPSRREKIIGRELGIQLVLTGFLIAHRPISESDSSVLFRSLTENETRKAIQGVILSCQRHSMMRFSPEYQEKKMKLAF